METFNIIGDVAGRYDELMLLISKMPEADKIILVGDIVDRGKQSKEVIEWAIKHSSMDTPEVVVIKGNHEDMMIDFYEGTNIYEDGIWSANGGNSTIKSYGCKLYTGKPSSIERIKKYISKEHIEWLKQLPIFFKTDGLFVSHAPWIDGFNLGEYLKKEDSLWNRYAPKKQEGVFQVFGHNSSLKQYGDYAICIDNSSKKVLTGLHWPTKEIFDQEYLWK